MKKTMTLGILTLAAAFGFAQETTPEVLPIIAQLQTTPAFPSIQEKVSTSTSFGYLKMGVSDSEFDRIDTIPGFGLGYRIHTDTSAIDISASYNYRKTYTEEGRETNVHYTLPRVNYLYYLSAKSAHSLYAGGGLAWGGVHSKAETFVGLIPNVALGYEINRTGTLRSFVQIDVSQPAIAAYKHGKLPTTLAELSVGAGF